jgi:hypothetical protein
MCAPTLLYLREAMTVSPDSVMIQVAIEDQQIIGFVICQNPGTFIPHVELIQTWIQPGKPQSVGNDLLAQAVIWATALGKNFIRGETPRNVEALYRRFKFQPTATVVYLDVSQVRHSLTTQIMEGLK